MLNEYERSSLCKTCVKEFISRYSILLLLFLRNYSLHNYTIIVVSWLGEEEAEQQLDIGVRRRAFIIIIAICSRKTSGEVAIHYPPPILAQ